MPTCLPLKRSAFTLIELLVGIGIIMILAALLFPALGSVRQRAQNAGCVSNLHQLGVAMGLWLGDYGCYPAPKSDGDGDEYPDSCREWDFTGSGDTKGRPSLFRTLYTPEAIPFLYQFNPPGSRLYHLKNTIFVCPAAVAGQGIPPSTSVNDYQSRAYGMNSVAAGGGSVAGWTLPIYPSRLASPSKTFLLIDCADPCGDLYYIYQDASNPKSFSSVSDRHQGHLNALYCDLHVGSINPADISKSKADPFWGYQPQQ